jgi:hypothetical protein
VCAALYYSGVDDKRERAGLSSQSSGWLGARGKVPLSRMKMMWSGRWRGGSSPNLRQRQVMAHIQFFMYQGYDSHFFPEAHCTRLSCIFVRGSSNTKTPPRAPWDKYNVKSFRLVWTALLEFTVVLARCLRSQWYRTPLVGIWRIIAQMRHFYST